MAGTICNFATQLKFYLGYDDCLDIFASHGVGGIVGNVRPLLCFGVLCSVAHDIELYHTSF